MPQTLLKRIRKAMFGLEHFHLESSRSYYSGMLDRVTQNHYLTVTHVGENVRIVLDTKTQMYHYHGDAENGVTKIVESLKNANFKNIQVIPQYTNLKNTNNNPKLIIVAPLTEETALMAEAAHQNTIEDAALKNLLEALEKTKAIVQRLNPTGTAGAPNTEEVFENVLRKSGISLNKPDPNQKLSM